MFLLPPAFISASSIYLALEDEIQTFLFLAPQLPYQMDRLSTVLKRLSAITAPGLSHLISASQGPIYGGFERSRAVLSTPVSLPRDGKKMAMATAPTTEQTRNVIVLSLIAIIAVAVYCYVLQYLSVDIGCADVSRHR